MAMLRIRTIFTGVAGTPYYSNLYFDSVSDAAQVNTDAVAAWWNDLEDFMVTGLSWVVQPEVTEMDEDGTITGLFPVTQRSGGGVGAGEGLPLANQALMRLNTGAYVGGRQIRGRIFIPGIIESASVSGVPSAGLITAANTGIAELDAESSGFSVWSKKNGSIHNVTSGSLWNQFAVLRSRRD